MSRLIDADKLLDDMKKELEKAVNDENLDKDECMVILTSAIALKDFVNRQPTAYNVDKVVEQLEEQKMWYETHGVNKDMNKGIIGATCKAIEIVKRGGLDE